MGLCAHGLATVRALSTAGIPVHAVDANESLPGFRTRLATVHAVDQINGPTLLDGLLRVRDEIGGAATPVLFPVNDTMVRHLAAGWPRLEGAYELSWSGCRDIISRLVIKSNLERHCDEVGVDYPRSIILHSESEIAGIDLEAPFIVKPVKPLSAFKALLVDGRDDLVEIARRYASDLPFLVQRWIPGSELHLYFIGFYFVDGRPVSEFVGRKLRSWPRLLGQTSIAMSYPDAAALAEGRKFFHGLDLTGPASIEFKRDADGRFWVIEPTLGRTDYWLPVCTHNGVDLSVVEYCHVTGQSVPEQTQKRGVIWIDSERDGGSLPWYLTSTDGVLRNPQRPTFPLLHPDDPAPFVTGVHQAARSLAGRATRKLKAIVRPG